MDTRRMRRKRWLFLSRFEALLQLNIEKWKFNVGIMDIIQ